MSADHVDFLVEEPSMDRFLHVLLPRVLPDLSFAVYPFQGKEELLRELPKRLRGYARWIPPGYQVVVLVDRDDDDCLVLKQRLERDAEAAGLSTRARRHGGRFTVVNRIVIGELESWFFGDWTAVRAAYPRVPTHIDRKPSYRNPDAIIGGTWEEFQRVLRRAGYYPGGLRKIEVATSIAPHLDPTRNRSHSFAVFWDAVRELAGS